MTAKTALVTGASKGIGAAVARALGQAGAYVVAQYGSDRDGARDALAGIPEEQGLLVPADLADQHQVRQLWETALAWRGRIDVLVNNAAVMIETPLDAPDAEWDDGWAQTLQVNVVGAASLSRAAVTHFRGAGGGIVITLSSWVAHRGPGAPELIAYAASKSAIKSLTQTIARHYAKDGVLAYIVAPGVVNTRLSETAAARTGGAAAVTATLPLGEWTSPEEIADLVAFLASGRARHLTGATLDVNGAAYIR